MVNYVGRFSHERIAEITREVQRRAEMRRDFVADRSKLGVVVSVNDEPMLRVDTSDTLLSFRRPSLQQLANTLSVPLRYIDRLQENGHVDLVADNLNTLLQREPKRHLIRTLDGEVDAVLSDRYKCLDNEDLLAIAVQEIQRAGAEIWDLRITRDEFRILAVAPHISGEVTTDRTFDPGDGWRSRWYGKEGDVLNAALTLGNSETGHGSLFARPSILRRVCANFCVWADGVARIHVGRRIEDEGEIFYSAETKEQENKLVWMQVKDLVRNTFDPDQFQQKIDLINETTARVIEKPTEAVEASIKAFGLPFERKEAILENLLQSGDRSQYGLAQSFTAQVNPKNVGSLDDEIRSAFEDAGGKLLGMNEREFQTTITA